MNYINSLKDKCQNTFVNMGKEFIRNSFDHYGRSFRPIQFNKKYYITSIISACYTLNCIYLYYYYYYFSSFSFSSFSSSSYY